MTGYDDDELDGICGFPTGDRLPPTEGDWVIGYVLFADVDRTDPVAVEWRAREWRTLFQGARP